MKYTHFLITSAICISLIGCNNDTKQTTQESTKINKSIRVAVNSGMPPFAYIDAKGNPIGFDIDLMNQIAQKNGYTVKFSTLPWQEMFDSIERGENDIAISAISYSTEREGKYLLSNPYVYMPAGILYPKNKITLNSLSDIKPLRLGIQSGSIFQKLAADNGITQISESDTVFLAFQKMTQNEIDAIISDKQIVQHLANQYPDYQLKVLEYGDINNKGSYAVAIAPKGSLGAIAMFNQGVADMKVSGELANLEKKWFENGGQSASQ